jgi:hypothetical protein
VNGFVQAFARFEERRMLRDAEDAFHSLFECLAWAASLDERLGYPTACPELRGLRFARHRVHHQWADALRFEEGADLSSPLVFPIVFFDYLWRDINELPPGRPSDPTPPFTRAISPVDRRTSRLASRSASSVEFRAQTQRNHPPCVSLQERSAPPPRTPVRARSCSGENDRSVRVKAIPDHSLNLAGRDSS